MGFYLYKLYIGKWNVIECIRYMYIPYYPYCFGLKMKGSCNIEELLLFQPLVNYRYLENCLWIIYCLMHQEVPLQLFILMINKYSKPKQYTSIFLFVHTRCINQMKEWASGDYWYSPPSLKKRGDILVPVVPTFAP